MKAQHSGNGRGRSPFLTSYALTLAFITFVSVLYFKDFSSTLHQPFLHRPPPRHRAGTGGRRAHPPTATPLGSHLDRVRVGLNPRRARTRDTYTNHQACSRCTARLPGRACINTEGEHPASIVQSS